jgi:selenide,water dikinase
MCRASGVGAVIDANQIPVVSDEVLSLIARDCIPGGSRDNLAYANRFVEWNDASDAQKFLLADAQTSGGLLLCVPRRKLGKALQMMKARKTICATVIGQVIRSAKPRVFVQTERNS